MRFCEFLCGSVWFCVVLWFWFCVVLCGSVRFCVVLWFWFCVVLVVL